MKGHSSKTNCGGGTSNRSNATRTRPSFADISSESRQQLWCEITLSLFMLLGLSLTYLNIYKTIWWLPPHGPSFTIVNFYLIDFYPFVFLILVILYRVQYLLSLIFSMFCDDRYGEDSFISVVVLYTLPLLLLISPLGLCVLQLLISQKLWQAMFLIYPIVLGTLFQSFSSCILFGNIDPLRNIRSEIDMVDKIDSFWVFGVKHVCLRDTKHIRKEVPMFWADVKNKCQLILFRTLTYTYYIGLIPIVLIPDHLVYDLNWILFHAAFVCETICMILFLQLMPHTYWNELYSSAYHLGLWKHTTGLKAITSPTEQQPSQQSYSLMTIFCALLPDFLFILSSKNSRAEAMHAKNAGYSEWNPSATTERGAHVIYENKVFTAMTNYPAAQPGNRLHYKYYILFSQPTTIHAIVLAIHILAILLQMCLFMFYYHWNEVISVCLFLFVNFFIMFKLMRDQFLMHNIYAAN